MITDNFNKLQYRGLVNAAIVICFVLAFVVLIYGVRVITRKSTDKPMPTSLKIAVLIALCAVPVLLVLIAAAVLE